MTTGTLSPSAQNMGHYWAAVDQAAAGGTALMSALVAAAAKALRAKGRSTLDLRERDALSASADGLQREEADLCAHYPEALLAAFVNFDQGKPVASGAAPTLEFDQLELMDEWQVEERVVIARVQQSVMLASEASLADLNTLMCGALGLKTVHPERNPLRPQAYLDALKEVLDRTDTPKAMRLRWLANMGDALGNALHALYLDFFTQLRAYGVPAAGYAVMQTPGSGGTTATFIKNSDSALLAQAAVPVRLALDGSASAVNRLASVSVADRQGPDAAALDFQMPAVSPKTPADETLLTLDTLRKLLTGELAQPPRNDKVASFADQFSREFESGRVPVDAQVSDFDATVPAALDALKEMQQVERVVQRLEQRNRQGSVQTLSGNAPLDTHRAHLPVTAKGVAQVLSLEVVKLMVDNIAKDTRLLAPIQQLIRGMEPALARLALVDPRVFTNKQHPARVLVQEVAHNSMAYVSTQATGFVDFLDQVQQVVGPLSDTVIENAEPFDHALAAVRSAWKQSVQNRVRDQKRAVKALEHAEQRNVLAEKIARQIAAHPDAAMVPAVVVEFLCGPWSQVVAHARITGEVGSGTADRYQALVGALLWSTHPQLTQNNSAKLTRLVPPLLATLREGLETIHYPSVKASAFIESLMGLHQKAFRANQKSRDSMAQMPDAVAPLAHPILVDEGNPWLAPDEARASNFMDLPDPADDALAPEPPACAPDSASPSAATVRTLQPSGELTVNALALGAWVELRVGEGWVRTQLTWTSPHGTLFLFTSALGATQSMTRRSRDKLVASGHLRIISDQPVVDSALDAVAQQAMRNSLGQRSA